MANKVNLVAGKSAGKCKCDCGCCNDMCALYGKISRRYHKVHPIFATIVFIVVIAAGFGALAVVAKNQANDISNLKTQISQLQSAAKASDVRENGVSYSGENGKTAMDLLKGKYQVETKDFSGMGEFVVAIDGVKAEDGVNFWAFYVDGKMAAEGAGTYKTKDSEKIEWRLEKIQ